MGFLIGELLDAGLLHGDVLTVAGEGLALYREEPILDNGVLTWRAAPVQSGDENVLRPVTRPFSPEGGLKLLSGNLGRAVIKTSAVKPEHRVVEAPALVFNNQEELMAAFDRGELQRDFVAVLRYQGRAPTACRSCTKLTPPLGYCRTWASRWRWSPMVACRVHPARCRRRFTSRRNVWPVGRWHGCAMAISFGSTASAGCSKRGSPSRNGPCADRNRWI